MKNNIYIKPVATIVAATIGAGVFGLPYVIARSGVWATLGWLALLGILLIINNLLLGEVALRLPDNLRFIGLVRKVFPVKAAAAVQVLTVINYFAVMVAYLLIGSRFLQTLLSLVLPANGTVSLWIYFAASALIIFVGVKFIEKLDVLTVSLLVVLFASLSLLAAPKAMAANINFFAPAEFFLPYGVILFSLGSAQVIPTLEASLKGNKAVLRKTIIAAGLIAMAITAVFGVSVAAVSGIDTSQDGVSGLASYLGNSIIVLGSVIGLVAILGVHTSIGNTTREIFHYDLKLGKLTSWALIVMVPMLIVLLSNVNFITALSFIGGVLSGLMGIVIGTLSLKSQAMETRQPEYHLKYSRFWAYVVMIFFFIGALYEIYFSFLK